MYLLNQKKLKNTVGSKYPVPLEIEQSDYYFSLGLTHGNWGNWYVVPFKTVPTVHENSYRY
jgi:hypothetical protein